MRIIWSPLSLERVAEIADYIARDNLTAAERWVDGIFKLVEPLEDLPKPGRIVPEIERDDFREVIKGNYRIIYRVEPEQVSILTVRHGKQILPLEEISV